jgi:hypothetical protein
MKDGLTKSHQHVYDQIHAHPVAHNLHWRDARSMLTELGEVVEQPNGKLKITCRGQSLVLPSEEPGRVLEVAAVMTLRHFLDRASKEPADKVSEVVAAGKKVSTQGGHFLVVIDHREALVYRMELNEKIPHRIVPHNPEGSGRYLHSVTDDANGQRMPELKTFYEAVMKSLQGAESILIFGSGTGASSAMVHLLEEMKKRHAELAKVVI